MGLRGWTNSKNCWTATVSWSFLRSHKIKQALCPISEIPALHSLGLWPKLVALQILRRSQKIREAPTESPFVVSTLCSLHYMHHLNWSSVARTGAVNWDLRVLWMLYGFMKLCLRYILSKCFDIAFACFLIHGPWICFQLSMQPKLSPSPEDTATPLLVERGLLEKHEKHWASYALFSGNPLFEACGSSKGQMIQKTVLRWT